MHYLALLYRDEAAQPEPGSPEWDAGMAGYVRFAQLHGPAIRGGEALHPTATAATVRNGDGGPLVTDGPYTETTEAVGGLYVLEAETLDDAIAMAADIPVAAVGGIELRPLAQWFDARPEGAPAGSAIAAGPDDRYAAFVRDKPGHADVPGTPEWDEMAAAHGRFGDEAGAVLWGGGALHPVSTATTVRSRDGEVLVSDGPYAEWAEAVGGFYLFGPVTRARAVELAGKIPAGVVELHRIVELA